MPRDQLSQEDTLVDRGLADALDEGYSPPEHQPATHRVGTTGAELHHGETWEQRLAQEVPEKDPYAESVETTWIDYQPEDPRAGRLVAPDEGTGPDLDSEIFATDVGRDGGAASAEEAAVHIVEDLDL